MISVIKTARSILYRSTDLEHLVFRSKRDNNKLSEVRNRNSDLMRKYSANVTVNRSG